MTIPEKPGSFKQFCNLVGARNITEFNYRYADPQKAHVFVGISVRNREEALNLIQILHANNLRAEDMTDNEMAKLHIRHMVGGHSREVSHEVLYRFEFPDRPGALMNFLNKMSDRWNISLFHYRNHGADFGRVLIGIQVLPQDKDEFMHFLDDLGYEFDDESNNPAYQFFLA